MSLVIKLNDFDLNKARQLTRTWYVQVIDGEYDPRLRHDGKIVEILYRSVCAEIAFAKHYGCAFSIPGTPDHVDVKYNGKTYNIKSTIYSRGKLLVPYFEKDDNTKYAERFCLMTGDPNAGYMSRGYIKKEDLLIKKRLKKQKNGFAFEASQYELSPIPSFQGKRINRNVSQVQL